MAHLDAVAGKEGGEAARHPASALNLTVLGFLDSPLWIDIDPLSETSVGLRERIRRLSNLVNLTQAYGQRCRAETPPEQMHLCAFGEHRLRYLESPFFLIQNQLDSYQLMVNGARPYDPANGTDPAVEGLRVELRLRTRSAAGTVDRQTPSGIFSPACERHCVSFSSENFWKVSANGTRLVEALRQWFLEVGVYHDEPRRGHEDVANEAPHHLWADTCPGAVECGGGCNRHSNDHHKKGQTGQKAAGGQKVGKAMVRIGGVVNRIRPGFACVNMDWWPKTKCDYGVCPWGESSVLTLDLDMPSLRTTLKALGPKVKLRVGGSLSDLITYKVYQDDDVPCKDFVPTHSTRIGFSHEGSCLTWKRWLELYSLCEQVDCEMIFMVNALKGRRLANPCPEGTDCRVADKHRPCCSSFAGEWNSTNARMFLTKVAASGQKLFGLEYGNEILDNKGIQAHLPPALYARGFLELANIVEELWPDRSLRPKLMGPNNAFQAEAETDLLRRVNGKIDILTHHMYTLGAGSSSKASTFMLTPTKLDRLWDKTRAAKAIAGDVEMWVGEAGGAYNSGSQGNSDAFIDGFWYNHDMGITAAGGYSTFCRQTFIGGNYGLVRLEHQDPTKEPSERNTSKLVPNPDFYSTVLWTHLVGDRALELGFDKSFMNFNGSHSFNALNHTKNEGISSGSEITLRGFAFCTRTVDSYNPRPFEINTSEGDVTLLLLNYDSSTSVDVAISNPLMRLTTRIEYHLTSDSMQSKDIFVNGHPLEMEDNNVPNLFEKGVPKSSSDPLRVNPYSVLFVHYIGLKHPDCLLNLNSKGGQKTVPKNGSCCGDSQSKLSKTYEPTMFLMLVGGFVLACMLSECLRRRRRLSRRIFGISPRPPPIDLPVDSQGSSSVLSRSLLVSMANNGCATSEPEGRNFDVSENSDALHVELQGDEVKSFGNANNMNARRRAGFQQQ